MGSYQSSLHEYARTGKLEKVKACLEYTEVDSKNKVRWTLPLNIQKNKNNFVSQLQSSMNRMAGQLSSLQVLKVVQKL